MRVLAVVLFPGGVIIQNAYVSRNMAFKGLSYPPFIDPDMGAISIFLAYRGLGVWAWYGSRLHTIFSTC